MSEETVKQLAEKVGTPVEKLLEQLVEAGLEVRDADDVLSNDEKMQLLTFLRRSHGKGDGNVSSPTTITLKRKQVGSLRVQRAAGKQSTVNVEYRKRKTYVKKAAVSQVSATEAEREDALRKLEESKVQREAELRQKEEAERLKQEAKEKARQEEEQKRREEEDRLKAAQEAAAMEVVAEETTEEAELEPAEEVVAEAPAQAEESVEVTEAEPTESTPAPAPVPEKVTAHREEKKTRKQEEEEKRREQNKKGKKGKRSRGGDDVYEVFEGDGESFVPGAGKRMTRRKEKHGFTKPTAPVVRDVAVPETITVADLAQRMAIKAAEVIKELMKMNIMATINQPLDQDTAILVAEELGHKAYPEVERTAETDILEQADSASEEHEMETRPPVVTVMGHVDHGKTSLLDHIRKSRVAAGEAGGITQHIGAYHVDTGHGVVTFLDTPGHAAFTAMRARGAQATDIVVLVVAADDGVMPQTIEAIQHARAGNVPLVVAVNKIDKPEADPDRVKTELSKQEVVPEDWGGDDIFVHVSAHTGAGIDELLEAILLQAEVLELKADPSRSAKGVVIESSLDKGRGPVATVLVQDGTLKQGDILLCGDVFGRVRALYDENAQQVKTAGPSIPVQVLGLSSVPSAGDDALVVASERKAREAAEFRQERARETRLQQRQAAKLKSLFENMGAGDIKEVNLLMKADVQGSVEALRDALLKLSNEEVNVNIVASGVGGITESDATLAMASNAILIGFNVRADNSAKKIISENEMDLHYYSVIYDAIDEVKKAISGVLGTETKEEILGLAEVKDVFRSSKFGHIAGCLVVEGVVRRESPIRVLRDNVVIYEGELESLRRFKDDVKEVQSGTECGIGVKGYKDVRAGDQIECFDRIEVARTLD